jgi:hypothetical protein
MNTPPDVLRALESLEANQQLLQGAMRRQRRVLAGTIGLCLALGGVLAISLAERGSGARVLAADAPAQPPTSAEPGHDAIVEVQASEAPATAQVPLVEDADPAVDADLAVTAQPTAPSPQEVELSQRVATLTAQIEQGERRSRMQSQEIERLRDELKRREDALNDTLRRIDEKGRAEREAQDSVKTDVPPVPHDPLVEAINARLLEHSVLEYRLLEYGEVSEQELRDSRWALCNGRGTAIGVLFAARCQITKDPANHSIVIRLLDGWATHGAEKDPLTEQRWVVPNANLEAWSGPPLDSLLAADPPPQAPPAPSPPSLEKVREQLGNLLEKYGFTLRQLDAVEGTELKRIVVDEGANGTAPKRTISAELCRIQLVEPGGYVEFVFENGSITRRGREMRFYGNRYRLALPHSVPSEWQQALPGMLAKRDSSRA